MIYITKKTHQFLISTTGQMFLGLILGDRSISKKRFEHTQKNLYCEYSKSICEMFKHSHPNLLTIKMKNESFYEQKKYNQRAKKTYICQTFYTKTDPIFEELATLFCPNGVKVIPIKLLNTYFTEISLFYLYLDDGRVARSQTSGLSLSLCNFITTELFNFQQLLNQKFSVKSTCHKNGRNQQVLYFSMRETRRLILQFIEIEKIVYPVGTIGLVKLQIKKSVNQKQMASSRKPNLQFYYSQTPSNLQLHGLIQGLIVSNANFQWNKNSTGYIRCSLMKSTYFTNWTLSILKASEIQFSLRDLRNDKYQIGISIPTDYYIEVIKIIHSNKTIRSLFPDVVLKNPYFWRTFFSRKGSNLTSQRGGLLIGLNHLPIQLVEQLSKALNETHLIKTIVRFRYPKNKIKGSIYICSKSQEKFYD